MCFIVQSQGTVHDEYGYLVMYVPGVVYHHLDHCGITSDYITNFENFGSA